MSASLIGPSPHKLMNLKITEFLNDLDLILGNLPDYVLFKQSVKLMSSFDESAVQRAFHRYIFIPCGDHIINENERFFMDSCKNKYDDVVIDFDLMRILKSKWIELSDCNKRAIWDHLQLLVVLNKRCL